MNSQRGGVTLKTVGGEYIVRITTGAMIRYKDKTGISFMKGMAALQKNQDDIEAIVNLFWVGVGHDKSITPEHAGEIIDDAGFSVAMAALNDAVVLAFPDSSSDPVGNDKAGKPAPEK